MQAVDIKDKAYTLVSSQCIFIYVAGYKNIGLINLFITSNIVKLTIPLAKHMRSCHIK